MPRDSIEAVGLTDSGNVRQFNEDRIVVDPDLGIMALADGMGGHRAGDVAADLAAEVVVARLRAHLAATARQSTLSAVNESIIQANQAVVAAARGNAAREGMGTTLAVAVFHDNVVALGHVGDSRIYRLRAGQLMQMTRDDSLLREAVDRGIISAEDASASHNRNLVTRALGAGPTVAVNVQNVPASPGDIYLLCSDGLTDLVCHADLELIMKSLEANLALAARTLVETAKDNGGYDNVSVILARVKKPFPAATTPSGWLARLFAFFGA
ncbi:MAG TPA: protein phosphatase 2C domain-containing protein [Casimicrobiaceae bacterium]|nr:protein phosphatase 2C domain-containing protein [Casimicrobiaceae bacterium]